MIYVGIGLVIAAVVAVAVRGITEVKLAKQNEANKKVALDAYTEEIRPRVMQEEIARAKTIKQNNTVKTEKVEDVEMGNN